MPQCQHGEKTFREGVGKTGKPYKAWFCPAPKGTPDQCPPEWVNDNASPEKKFDDGMDQLAAIEKQRKEVEGKTRTQVVKSLIAAGAKFCPESVEVANRWTRYCLDGKLPTAPPVASHTASANEIRPEDVPF